MENLKLNEMSNSEIKIMLVEYENEYDAVKNKIRKNVERLNELDSLYNKAKSELRKRNVL